MNNEPLPTQSRVTDTAQSTDALPFNADPVTLLVIVLIVIIVGVVALLYARRLK